MYKKLLLTIAFSLIIEDCHCKKKVRSSLKDENPGNLNWEHCGMSKKKNSNIVGGELAAENEFPWIVSLQRPKGNTKQMVHFCGASLITNRWILTAAHCFMGAQHSFKKFQAGLGMTKWNESKAAVELEKYVIHENYDEELYANDICLVKTKTPVPLHNTSVVWNINNICIPKPPFVLPDKATVYGWGLLKEDGNPSLDLMKLEVKKEDLKKCNVVYKEYIGDFTKQMMCYGMPGKDSCKGDSGGPLSEFVKPFKEAKKKKMTQIGIVSFGLGCARNNTPGIYQDVSQYYDWIVKTMKDNP